ncbi:HEAT repeat domain-containing protein [Streptomyces sp. NPDC059914]
MAMEFGWTPVGTREESEESPFTEIWQEEGSGTLISFVHDSLLGIDYLLIRGTDAAKLTQQIQSKISTYTRQSIFDELRQTGDRETCIAGLYRASLIGGKREERDLFEAIASLAEDSDPEVRHAVIVAGAYLAEWPSMRALLLRLRDDDPEETVRRDARTVLEALPSI